MWYRNVDIIIDVICFSGREDAMAEKKRMANLELLRCVAMMMVVVLHYLGKGGLLPDLTGSRLDCAGVTA